MQRKSILNLVFIMFLIAFSSISIASEINTEKPLDDFYFDPIFPYQWHLENTGQTGGTPGEDLNVRHVWEKGITGKGIIIGVVGEGIQHTHPDISRNFLPEFSYDFAENDNDPYVSNAVLEINGTSLAGLIAARDNDICGLGVAYRANFAGLKFSFAQMNNENLSKALSFNNQSIDIYQLNFTMEDNGSNLIPLDTFTLESLKQNVETGRNNLGNIYVCPAGDGLEANDNVNYNGYVNSPFTIAVSAVDHNGKQTNYSEPGAAILVCAPGGSSDAMLSTIDLIGRHGSSVGNCRNDFLGTWASSANVSGVIALILQARPDLSWRDIQHILVKTAYKNDPEDSDWATNGAGLHINHKYGFGRIDAKAAVELAETSWNAVTNNSSIPYVTVVRKTIPDNDEYGINSVISVPQNLTVEHVEVVFNAKHSKRGDLQILLTSPSGTKSVLADVHNDSNEDYTAWKFMTVRNWDESSQGDWTLNVADLKDEHLGEFISWELILHVNGDPGPLDPIARDDSVLTSLNTPVTIDILANDFDPNGDRLSIKHINQPSNGVVVLNADNTITYTPNNFFTGEDSFSYTVEDGNDGSATAIVTVTTSIVKDGGFEEGSPNPFWKEYSKQNKTVIKEIQNMAHSGDYYVSLQGGNENEHALVSQEINIPPGQEANLTFWLRITSHDVFGRFNIRLDDWVVFTTSEADAEIYAKWKPVVINLNDFADDSSHTLKIEAAIRKGSGNTEFLIDDVSLTLGAQKPSASDDYLKAYSGSPSQVHVLLNDFDPNRDKLTIVEAGEAKHGKVTVNIDNTITYISDENYIGDDQFEYIISDIKTGTDKATVFVEVLMEKKLKLEIPLELSEGDDPVLGKISIPAPMSENLLVNLELDDETEISIEEKDLTITAGNTFVEFSIKIIDDVEIDGDQRVKITASSPNWESAEKTIEIIDNDTIPILSVSPDIQNVPNVLGITVFNVTNAGGTTMNWTAVTNDSWLKITDGNSGTNDGTISVQYNKNTSAQRTVTITISSNEAENKKVTVNIIQNSSNIIALGGNEDHFARGLALSDNFIIIGSNFDGDNDIKSGSVYLVEHTGNSWKNYFRIVPEDGQENDLFGRSVSISNIFAIAGAQGHDSRKGAAYILKYENKSWSIDQKLVHENAQTNDCFGCCVSIFNDYAIVGAYKLDSKGAAFIYKKQDDEWTFIKALTPYDGKNEDRFGYSVAISENYAVVGSTFHDNANSMSGSVYIYENENDSWTFKQQVCGEDTVSLDSFGASVAINNDLLIAGSNGGNAAYVFALKDSQWTQVSKLTSEDVKSGDDFGDCVSITENFAIVGASNHNANSGAAYLYEKDNNIWNYKKKLTSETESGNFGSAVAIKDNLIIVGAHNENNQTGSAYLFNAEDPSLAAFHNLKTPGISITEIPDPCSKIRNLNRNLTKDLKGTAFNAGQKNYHIAVYTFYNGWNSRPEQVTKIDKQGKWSCDLGIGPNASKVKRIAAFLLPVWYMPDFISGIDRLPKSLIKTASASIYVSQLPDQCD